MYHSKRTRFLILDYRPHQDLSRPFPEDVRTNIYQLTFLDLHKDDREKIYKLALDVRRQDKGFFGCISSPIRRTTDPPLLCVVRREASIYRFPFVASDVAFGEMISWWWWWCCAAV
jgi:hypothetical protein